MRRKYFNQLLIISVFIISSCSSDNWSKVDQNKFIDSCRLEEGAKSYCICFMKATMEEYPIYEESLDIEFEEAVELSKNCD